jgi:hypothetical protein
MLKVLKFLLTPAVVIAGASENLPTVKSAKISQRDDFGAKLKLKYLINSAKDEKVSVCSQCDINTNGERTSNAGYETVGSTCGGYPNGCAVFKQASWIFKKDQVSLHFRVGESLWSTEPVVYTGIAEAVKGESGVTLLTLEEAKGEL